MSNMNVSTGISARHAASNVARMSVALRGLTPYFFHVEPFGDRFKVSFCKAKDTEKEIKRWFRERGHQARVIDYGYLGGWYVKCSRDTAMLAKLTFGGDL